MLVYAYRNPPTGDDMKYNKLSYNGRMYGYGELVDEYLPEGGDSVSMGWQGMHPRENRDAWQYVEVPYTLWGDYCGDSVGRSNFRSLVRDFPDTFVEVYGDYGSHYLALPRHKVTLELHEIMVGLVDRYCLYDEEDHSNLEMEETDAAWDGPYSYLWGDLCRDLERACWDPSVLGHDKARDLFYEWLREEANEYPYLESATSLYIPAWSDFVAYVIEHAYTEDTSDFNQE